jgi:hypothetical protein
MESYSYNADGNRIAIDYDYTDPSTNDRSIYYTYNKFGQIVEARYDDNNDSHIDKVYHYTRNIAGQTLSLTQDNDADGNIDKNETYVLDINGKVLERHYDTNYDGVLDRKLYYTYNSAGQTLILRYDNDADGFVDRADTYVYNLYGQKIETHSDLDNDMAVDTIIYTTLDIKGRTIKTEYDYDSSVDNNINIIYDQPRNKYGEETFRSADTNVPSDPHIDYIVSYSNGNILDLSTYLTQHDAEGLSYIHLSSSANKANMLVVDNSSLNTLAGAANPYALKVVGDANDVVTATGATATGNTVSVGGIDYVEYSFGTAGVTFYVEPTVNVNIL